jgi:hypothetical protein
VCSSLDQALDYLDKDREFLTRGGVFTNDMIDALYGAEDGRSDPFPDDHAFRRVRHVLLVVRGAARAVSVALAVSFRPPAGGRPKNGRRCRPSSRFFVYSV